MTALSDAILAVIMEEPTPTSNEEAEVLAEKIADAAIEGVVPYVGIVTDMVKLANWHKVFERVTS